MRLVFRLIIAGLILTACSPAVSETLRPVATPTAALTILPDSTSTQIPVPTPRPSQTPRPSRTPKPSPTLPNLADFSCLPADGERVSGVVAGVIDGDTITVQVGIQKFTVRYIGVDTPETNVQPPEKMGPEATTRNRELVSGKRVTLVSDPGVGNTDRYNRLLRYVILEDAFVNATLVREGYARYYASPNAACGGLMFAAEKEARSAKAGIWNP